MYILKKLNGEIIDAVQIKDIEQDTYFVDGYSYEASFVFSYTAVFVTPPLFSNNLINSFTVIVTSVNGIIPF